MLLGSSCSATAAAPSVLSADPSSVATCAPSERSSNHAGPSSPTREGSLARSALATRSASASRGRPPLPLGRAADKLNKLPAGTDQRQALSHMPNYGFLALAAHARPALAAAALAARALPLAMPARTLAARSSAPSGPRSLAAVRWPPSSLAAGVSPVCDTEQNSLVLDARVLYLPLSAAAVALAGTARLRSASPGARHAAASRGGSAASSCSHSPPGSGQQSRRASLTETASCASGQRSGGAATVAAASAACTSRPSSVSAHARSSSCDGQGTGELQEDPGLAGAGLAPTSSGQHEGMQQLGISATAPQTTARELASEGLSSSTSRHAAVNTLQVRRAVQGPCAAGGGAKAAVRDAPAPRSSPQVIAGGRPDTHGAELDDEVLEQLQHEAASGRAGGAGHGAGPSGLAEFSSDAGGRRVVEVKAVRKADGVRARRHAGQLHCRGAVLCSIAQRVWRKVKGWRSCPLLQARPWRRRAWAGAWAGGPLLARQSLIRSGGSCRRKWSRSSKYGRSARRSG
jgi:hypothetical protein